MTNSLFKDSHITHTFRPLSAPYNSGQGVNKGKGSSATVNNSIREYNNKPADKTNFCGFFNSGIYTNKGVKNVLEKAARKPAVFNALLALPLTCILRPAAIMALPGDSKHKDDKKYAAAHSVASGVIGYGFSELIFGPLGSAMKKISNNLPGYAKKFPKLHYLTEEKNESKKSAKLVILKASEKAASNVTKKAAKTSMSYMDRATQFANMVPETLLAAPRALVTVALIPPILKYVFGWEKKKSGAKPAADNKVKSIVDENPALVNFKSTTDGSKVNSSAVSFKGSAVNYKDTITKSKFFAPVQKFFSPLTRKLKVTKRKAINQITKGFCYLLGTKRVENLIKESTSSNLPSHLTALTGFVLSGFYIQQTLKNKNLDEQKRNTLAINQGLVSVVSTIGAYALNRVLGEKQDAFSKKFIAMNQPLSPNFARTYKTGIKTAFSLMVFGVIYRFISPVFVTPFANKLGSKFNEKKQAELARKKAAENK